MGIGDQHAFGQSRHKTITVHGRCLRPPLHPFCKGGEDGQPPLRQRRLPFWSAALRQPPRQAQHRPPRWTQQNGERFLLYGRLKTADNGRSAPPPHSRANWEEERPFPPPPTRAKFGGGTAVCPHPIHSNLYSPAE